MLLAIETALTACSAALIDGGTVIAERHEELARGHAERIVPMIAELLGETGIARADEVVVDIGPGSFTGLRVGIAAAKAFGLAWRAPVRGTTSTALVAQAAFAADPGLSDLCVVFDAGRGQVYLQPFGRAGPTGEIVALDPAAALAVARGHAAVAGSGVPLLPVTGAALHDTGARLPRAADVRHLPDSAFATPSPLYVRAPDAVAAP